MRENQSFKNASSSTAPGILAQMSLAKTTQTPASRNEKKDAPGIDQPRVKLVATPTINSAEAAAIVAKKIFDLAAKSTR
jgi:hypothetical protein